MNTPYKLFTQIYVLADDARENNHFVAQQAYETAADLVDGIGKGVLLKGVATQIESAFLFNRKLAGQHEEWNAWDACLEMLSKAKEGKL